MRPSAGVSWRACGEGGGEVRGGVGGDVESVGGGEEIVDARRRGGCRWGRG